MTNTFDWFILDQNISNWLNPKKAGDLETMNEELTSLGDLIYYFDKEPFELWTTK